MTEPKRRPLYERLGENRAEVHDLLVEAWFAGERYCSWCAFGKAEGEPSPPWIYDWLDENFGGKE